MSGQSSSASLTEWLAAHLDRPVDAATRQRAACHVLDWSGCALAGLDSAPATAMRDALAAEAAGECTTLGGRSHAGLTAVMINGGLGNVLEMDDVDKRAILHPGPVVIPAALAAAEMVDASGTEFLDAIVRGYEAVIAVGRAVGPTHYAYWHNTGTCGPFGAAAAAASIFGLDLARTVMALGLAGTQASGFWQTRHEPQSMAKQLHTARAAHAGLSAALLARSGFNGPRRILEGPQGFFAATCGAADPEAVVSHLSSRWLIHDVSFKPWPACRHAHAAIDAALVARDQLGLSAGTGLDAASVREIVVTTYRDAVAFCDRAHPDSVIEAKFSIQHAVAVVLARGAPGLSDFHADAFDHPALRALAGRVKVAVGEPYQSRYPARYGVGLAVTLADGRALQIDMPDALGDPENPLSTEALLDKAIALATHAGRSQSSSRAIGAAALALAEGGALNAWTRLLGAAA